MRVFAIDLHPHPKPDLACLEHTAAVAGSTEARFDRLREKPSALNEHSRLPGTEHNQLVERVVSTHLQPRERLQFAYVHPATTVDLFAKALERTEARKPAFFALRRAALAVFRMRLDLERACKFMRLTSSEINYHPHSGWFDEGPSKGPPPCGRGLKPPEVQLFLSLFFFLLVSDVLPNDGLV